jgi:hypothetical protein
MLLGSDHAMIIEYIAELAITTRMRSSLFGNTPLDRRQEESCQSSVWRSPIRNHQPIFDFEARAQTLLRPETRPETGCQSIHERLQATHCRTHPRMLSTCTSHEPEFLKLVVRTPCIDAACVFSLTSVPEGRGQGRSSKLDGHRDRDRKGSSINNLVFRSG